MTLTNAQWRLAARPSGLPKAADWQYTEEPAAEAGDGQIRVAVQYLSLDPAMRSWMNPGRSYVPPVGIGEVMRAGGIAEVIDSRHRGFEVGQTVFGTFGVQAYAVSDGTGVSVVDTALAPAPVYLNTLGTGGLTAYFGLLEVGRPEAGQTVVVSAAAGSVGSITGQLAKIHGCRVVGIAGGAEKCRVLVEELGFDAAVDYKAGELRAQLREQAPDGIDVFFDNVGGEILEAVLSRLARGARIVLSGAVSQYNTADAPRGPANYMQLLVNRASMTGFVFTDYANRFPEATKALAGWLADGSLVSREHLLDGGIGAFPEALLKLFAGENTGKLILAL
ncbi:NADP-dependent oxidoreductase [Amycolatopsis sp. H20-H5]|uniref:NADP-dependent oxidoreductase n=1 Tax=Amycolatopsis sp. H20-H5 TaxID=3046309 RepID=UPI002DBC6E2F|nr:NADP-dependent oxidoreductase [Amycolatopsis sp. H20-H5]MEC3981698.1 NADP-dependent oxidoreductase [Amycolatopsis sp. H20-H5]